MPVLFSILPQGVLAIRLHSVRPISRHNHGLALLVRAVEHDAQVVQVCTQSVCWRLEHHGGGGVARDRVLRGVQVRHELGGAGFPGPRTLAA